MSSETRAELVQQYCEDKFEKHGLVYMTKKANSDLIKAVGENVSRGPWIVIGMGSSSVGYHMSFRNSLSPPWKDTAYIDDDPNHDGWLTEEEYFIERIKLSSWERSFYEPMEISGKVTDEMLERPELWVPEIDSTVHVYRSKYNDMQKITSASETFISCSVEEVDYDADEFDIRNLPRLTVEIIGKGGGGHGIVKNVSPLLCC